MESKYKNKFDKAIDWLNEILKKCLKRFWKSGNNENNCKNILNTKMINHHNLE